MAKVKEFVVGEDIPSAVGETKFSVLSIFRSNDPKSAEVDRLMDGASAFFEGSIINGTFAPRDLAWYRIDLDTNGDAL